MKIVNSYSSASRTCNTEFTYYKKSNEDINWSPITVVTVVTVAIFVFFVETKIHLGRNFIFLAITVHDIEPRDR